MPSQLLLSRIEAMLSLVQLNPGQQMFAQLLSQAVARLQRSEEPLLGGGLCATCLCTQDAR